MTIPAGPEWVEEHIRRLSANGIQTHFQLASITQLETVERMMRRGVCNVPLIMTWVAIGGGFDAPNIYNLANFVRATPDGSVLTLETSMLNVLPINMMAIAMGLHVRCGIEDNIWTQDRKAKMGSIKQIEQLVRISREFGRDVANASEARGIYKIGTFYQNADETLAANGFAPNRKPARAASAQLPELAGTGDDHGTGDPHVTKPAAPRCCASRTSPSASPGPARRACATSRSASTSPTRISAPVSTRCRCPPAWGSRRPASSRPSARA